MTETTTHLHAEVAAIQSAAAMAMLADRAFLRISGPDATRWLNGMVTNAIATLAPGEGNYNFVLNAQGRILGDAYIYREAGEPATFLLATDAAQAPVLHMTLDRFIIMDDVEIGPADVEEASLLLLGPEAAAALQELALPAIDPLRVARPDSPLGALRLLTTEEPHRFELRASTAVIQDIEARLGLPMLSAEALEAWRVFSGRPRYGVDIRNSDAAKDLPQETNQTHALHFSKGCYLGQEIVERIRSRGQVHRLFTKFELQGAPPSTLPASLTSAGKPAGELTSVAALGDRLYALGYARREFLDTGAPLQYDGGTATPRP